MEATVTRVWAEVLGRETIGATENFFDLGGNSLRAMEVISRLQGLLNIELPLIAFFEDPTVAHLAAVIENLQKEQSAAPAPTAITTGEVPLSFSQLTFWLLQQRNPASCLYNEPRIMRVRGLLRADILERSLNELCRRHEVVRTRLVPGIEEPAQVVDPAANIELGIQDLSSLASDKAEDAALAIAHDEWRKPFDLSAGPGLRARLLRLADADHVLVIILHHSVSDGYTSAILFDELSTIYDALAEGHAHSLADAGQYRNYAVWERSHMRGERLEKELEYWRNHLKDAPPLLHLPTDRPSPEHPGNVGSVRSILVPAATVADLKSRAQATGTTLFSMMLGALRVLLSRWTAQRDIVIGTVASNRSRAGTERMIGCFLNFLPLRNYVDSEEKLLEVLGRERQAVMDAFVHQACPFVEVAAAVSASRAGVDNPIYNVAFLLQNFPEIKFTGKAFSAELVPLQEETALLDLRFLATERADGMQLDCEFKTELFDRGTIEHLLQGFVSVLEKVAADPSVRVGDVAIPPALAEQAEIARRREQKTLLAITATFTADPVAQSLNFWMQRLGIPSRIEFAPYNQVFQELLDPSSLTAANRDGVNIVLVRMEDWLRFDGDHSVEDTHEKIGGNTQQLIDAIRASAKRSSASLLLCLCPCSKRALADAATAELFRQADASLVAELSDVSRVQVLTSSQVMTAYPVSEYEDEYADKLGHIPYTPDFFNALGTMLARRVSAPYRRPHKVIVLDCDNTLWKGVCGEEGPLGVVVDPPHRALQEFMVGQQDSGMLLCLCSKNAEEDVTAVFEQNPGMVLRRHHIAASRINWTSKSQNLRALAQELQLGLDSFVLLDDNPLECEEVRRNCPEVLTIELPGNAADIPQLLQHVWAFDHWTLTEEDKKRTALYRANVEREQVRKGAAHLEAFLAGLELKIDVRPMQPDDLARVAQLTERTNQFNFTTIRRSQAEIEQVCESGSVCLVVNVRDRFGDYGLVGVLIFSAGNESITSDTFLLSCRALGRKVEHHMLAKLGEIAQSRRLARVDVPYVQTRKNEPALNFLESVGSRFKQISRTRAVYQFPAEYASKACELDVARTEAPRSSEEARPVPQLTTQTQVLARIATELRDVGAITQEIELQKVLRSQDQQRFMAPRTAAEEIVAGIWARLLKVDRLGIYDNFFSLGGHSILATQAVARIRQTLGVELPLRAVFEAPTVAELAARIGIAQKAYHRAKLPPLVPSARKPPVPLSFAQQRLWFLDQLEPGNALYNVPQMFRVRHTLRIGALRQSLNEIVRRHEVLRTTFATADNEPIQVIAPALDLQLTVIEIRATEDQREVEIQRLAKEESTRPFDLFRGPLIRATLLRIAEDDHALLLTMHHVVSDRWSMGVLTDELISLYTAFSQGKPSPLPELPVQYADYAVWQRGWLSGDVLDEQIAYWKKQLTGAPPVLELRTDRPRPVVQTYRGATQKLVLPTSLLQKLIVLSQIEGATLFMTLLSAFQVLLARYSGQEDIVVGSPIANRNHTEVESLIGFFVNTLAMRSDLSGDPSFRDLLARVKEVALGAYAHQDIPFEKLVEELQPERSLSHNPIFQVLFALQNAPMETMTRQGLHLERVPVYTDTSMFDMSWFAIEVPDGLLLRAEYNTDLFDHDTIARALLHFKTALEDIVTHPDRNISELRLLTDAEKRKVLIEFNDTAIDYPTDVSLHSFFEAQVERTPDAIALVYEEQKLTYRELNERSNRLAHHLRELGVQADDLIGICTHRSLEMVVGLYGILKAGAAYVPLDPDYPRERLAMMLEDAQPKVLLTQERLLSTLPEYSGTAICLDRDWSAVAAHPAVNPAHVTGGANLAYAIYTSGSTGKPKGVQLEHRSVVNFLCSMRREPGLADNDVLVAVTTLSFDIAGLEMYLPLLVGARLVVANVETTYDGRRLSALLQESGATVMQATPATWRLLFETGWEGDRKLKVLVGGEAVSPELARRLAERCGPVWNMYGPTETTIWSSVYPVNGTDERSVPIGRPIANTQIYLLDKNLQPVPIGIAGELHIGGIGLARGYLNLPELTAEKFIADPFSHLPRARLYKTGDLARFLPDGNIEYLSRIDHQVKIRGFRIELGEIEAVLERHPQVRQTVVMAREDEPGNKRLVAYVVPEQSKTPSAEDLRAHLRTTLPEFMVPSAFVMMDAFPLSSSGKVNRRALPVPEYGRPEQVYVAPSNETEERIASIWSEVLHVPQVGIHDDFFLLGGHSLRATQVVSRLRQAFHVEVPLRAMFESPTVAGLAKRLQAAKDQPDSAPIPRVRRNQVLPLSFAQQRLWFLDQLEPNNPLYNIPWALRISGKLDPQALEASLNAIVGRHEALRTSFHSDGDQPVQVIAPTLRIPLTTVDLSEWPEEERRSRADELISKEALRPFDLTKCPLLRSTLLRIADEEHVLVLNIHHIISDRWSMGVLSQELAALYAAQLEGKPSPLQELPVQYADFAVWQRELLQGNVLEQHLSYWKEQLQDAPPVLELPTDRPRLAVETFRGTVATTILPPSVSEQLNRFSRENGATLFMTLLAGFQVLLARYSGQDDIVVGAPIANRNRTETESLIGFFANTLALRARFGGEPTFAALLNQVKEVTLAAYARQDLPFEKLVEELRPERSLSHNPLVQVFFSLQNAPFETLQLKGLDLKPIETETKSAKGDLFFSLFETAEGIRGRMEYNTDLFDAATIQRMFRHYRVLLEAAVANPELRVAELPLLTGDEREQLISEWNSTEFDYPRHLCLHELFEQQAERTPHAIACLYRDEQISYSELNHRANQLAHYLRQRGIGPGQRVGIFVERSLAMMVGLLGIQKSAAAYVPLDPAYPAERLRLIVDDAQLPVILTLESQVSSLPAHAAEVIYLDRDWGQIASQPTNNPHSGASPEDFVYVIFTSGSAGRPKGVQVPHRAVVNLLSFMAQELRMGPEDVFPALASFAFDMCIPELYLALVTGGRVVIGDRHLAANGEELATLLRKTGATVVHATPTTWNLLLDAGFTGKGLKRVIGAEPLPGDLCRRLLEADPSLYNFYGPTETTVWSTFHHFRSPDESVVVGRPLANTQVYILDRKLQPVPIGVPGEIHIAGDGVTYGYLNRPELTAEKFIADPFSKRAGAKMYKTGDVGRFLANGRIEFQGRADNQVKVRGYRIELGEIEAVLGKHADVKECAVVAREDVPGDKRLVAYVVASNGTASDINPLRRWAKEHLPDYMVPVAFVTMEQLPLSPNGKVNRKALPAPDYARPELSGEFQQARTPVEEIIAHIWAEVLKLDAVGVHDNFFELGGHSLLATQVVSRIRRTFQVDLPLRGLFEAPTVAGLAHKIEPLEKGIAAPPITRVPRDRNLPLSFAQQRLWFLDQLEPNNPLYNVPFVVRMCGKLNSSVLEKSIKEIVRRHETLRTTFRTANDEPVQVIAPSLDVPLATTDLSHLALADREAEARRLAMEELKTPFNLAAGPLLRASLFRLDDEDHALVINTHHIISDRWSLGVLSQELAALYEAYLNGKESPLAELSIQYADYAVFQRQFWSGETLDQQLNYWRHQLEGAPFLLELPTDHPRQAVENFWGSVHQQPLGEELIRSLRLLSRQHSVTFFMTLLAAFQALLARSSGQNDVVVGTDLANRTQVETEPLIGFFVNILPMRMRFAGDPTFSEVLGSQRDTALGAYAHQDIPFDKLVEELRPERSSTHNPLVQVLFVMQNTPQPVKEFGGLKLGPLGVSSTSRFDLVLFINDPEGNACATWMYNPNLFDDFTIARIASVYEVLLQTVATDPDITISNLAEHLAAAERKYQLDEQKKFEEASVRKLKGIKRRAVTQA